jgi:hypothetical protein
MELDGGQVQMTAFVHDFINEVNFLTSRIAVSVSRKTRIGMLATWAINCTKCSQLIIRA